MENFPIPNEPVLQCKPSTLMATHRRATTIMGQISFTERVWPKECNNKTRKSSRKSWMPTIFTKFGLRKSSSQHVIPGQIPTIINNVCQIYKTRKSSLKRWMLPRFTKFWSSAKRNSSSHSRFTYLSAQSNMEEINQKTKTETYPPTNSMLSIVTKFSSLEDIANWPHRVIHS